MSENEPQYLRFRVYHRVNHFVMVVAFLGLVITGMPLKYSFAPWASSLARMLGGFESAGFLHRVCAVLTAFYFAMHLLHVLRLIRKDGPRRVLWGPDSMVPQPRDLRDLVGHFKWFLGSGRRPKFERYAYWEKFDYFAVFWGVTVIGLSGLVMWFPTWFTRFLPGWIVNIALVIHSDEALLATGFIFTVHLFNCHLRPGKFPIDISIFTGRVSRRELIADHAGQLARMEADGTLAATVATPPEEWLTAFGKIAGYTALAIGVAFVGLIVWTFVVY